MNAEGRKRKLTSSSGEIGKRLHCRDSNDFQESELSDDDSDSQDEKSNEIVHSEETSDENDDEGSSHESPVPGSNYHGLEDQKMMKNMGLDEGYGLGRHQQGRVKTVLPEHMSSRNSKRKFSSSTSSEEDLKRPHFEHSNDCDKDDLSDDGLSNQYKKSNEVFYTERDTDENDDNDEESAHEKRAPESNYYNLKVQKMMKNMGHKEGYGLGRHQQGRVDIVEPSKQKGRRGLGLGVSRKTADSHYEKDKEVIKTGESIDWLECHSTIPDLKTLMSWAVEGPKKDHIDDETEFCDGSLISKLLNAKNGLDDLTSNELLRARTRCNPYELIKSGIFMNRAAMKMANIDYVADFLFSKIEPQHVDLLYFADICSGPGGFSEYVLWRKRWRAKGFGFTLRGDCDFKLENFLAGSCETFEPFYGPHNDGDIYKEDNIVEFKKLIMESTDNTGVDFVMADGGFPYKEEANIQEIKCKQIYLCQMLCALCILREGGHFLCKIFDTFTPYSVGLLYLMYCAFERIAIFKPVTSRPANSERYLIGHTLKSGTQDIIDYLFEVNRKLTKYSSRTCNISIMEIVPDELLKETSFYNYIYDKNVSIIHPQINSLLKIVEFHENPQLVEETQHDLRQKLLEIWGVPDKARQSKQKIPPAIRLQNLKLNISFDNLNEDSFELKKSHLTTLGKEMNSWMCMVLGSQETETERTRTYYYGCGRQSVFKYISRKWVPANLPVELYPDTLVYGEMVTEYVDIGTTQRRVKALHIIDAMLLGGENIRYEPHEIRVEKIKVYCRAVSKLSRPYDGVVRLKEMSALNSIEDLFRRLSYNYVKGHRDRRTIYHFENDRSRFIIPTGLIMVRGLKSHYGKYWSKTQNKPYWFNSSTGASDFHCPKDAVLDFMGTVSENVYFWWWKDGVKIMNHHRAAEGLIHKENLLEICKSGVKSRH